MTLNNDWNLFLKDEFNKDYFVELQNFIKIEYETKIIYPKYEDIFRAFNLLPLDKVKVVIIGQDPYHGFNQANGLAFSVSNTCKIPPSLKNIFKELFEDMNCSISLSGDLMQWSKEGVLLMNTSLTVVHSKPNSHNNKGWEVFTDSVIKKLSLEFKNLVFILWGSASQKKEILIDSSKHLILKASHPSPLSSYRSFFGSKPFSKTNEYLKMNKISVINWCLT